MATSSTTWQKGCQSPNPGGRPKALHDLQELAREHTEAAIKTLADIMNDVKAPHSARLSAAEALLSRGWGRPILPTVQTSTEKSFEEWLDQLQLENPEGYRMLETAVERDRQELADLDTDGTA
jgi:hypothetical protein